jgi:hypothetical protein
MSKRQLKAAVVTAQLQCVQSGKAPIALNKLNLLQATTYETYQQLFDALRRITKTQEQVVFMGRYEGAEDPLVPMKQQTETAMEEVWRVTGYRFTYVCSGRKEPILTCWYCPTA